MTRRTALAGIAVPAATILALAVLLHLHPQATPLFLGGLVLSGFCGSVIGLSLAAAVVSTTGGASAPWPVQRRRPQGRERGGRP